MDVKGTMHIGCNRFYPIPPDIHEGYQAERFINRMTALGYYAFEFFGWILDKGGKWETGGVQSPSGQVRP